MFFCATRSNSLSLPINRLVLSTIKTSNIEEEDNSLTTRSGYTTSRIQEVEENTSIKEAIDLEDYHSSNISTMDISSQPKEEEIQFNKNTVELAHNRLG